MQRTISCTCGSCRQEASQWLQATTQAWQAAMQSWYSSYFSCDMKFLRAMGDILGTPRGDGGAGTPMLTSEAPAHALCGARPARRLREVNCGPPAGSVH